MRVLIKLLPLLLLYIVLIIAGLKPECWTDECGYIAFANNLTHGHYSPRDEVDLWWGPGYPIVLTPFVILKAPWTAARLLNAFFLFLAVLYFYHTIRLYTSSTYALYFAYLFGLYLPFLRFISYLLTETFVVLLVSGIIYHFCKLNQQSKGSRRHLLLTGVFLGYLALTKVVFGYAIMAGLILAVLAFMLLKRDHVTRNAIFACCIAYIVCLPYLLYTHSLTGKLFYWGTAGGVSLYYMSSPYEGEFGDYGPTFSNRSLWAHYQENLKGGEDSEYQKWAENHSSLFAEVSKLSSTVEQDDAFKKAAILNIRSHPVKYFKNWLSNIGRLLFGYPNSYALQTPRIYFWALPNMFIFVLGILSIYPLWHWRRTNPREIYMLLFFAIISIGGTSLLSAQPRQFYVITPLIDVAIIVAWVNAFGMASRREIAVGASSRTDGSESLVSASR